MPSARELLAQADALMRRNRAGMIDTEIPELKDIAMVAPVPAAVPAALDDVPELTEAVEEIEIESIVELPEDIDELSGWLHHEHGELIVVDKGRDAAGAVLPKAPDATDGAERARTALAVVPKRPDSAPPPPEVPAATPGPAAPPVTVPSPVTVVAAGITASPAAAPPASAPAIATPAAPAIASPAAPTIASPAAAPPQAADSLPGAPDEGARWEVLADEILMQVLQRIDIFTDTGLRDQLSAQLQPIVDRASAEMISTINEHVGGLLRAYIAEAIEREIEKWRAAEH